MTKYVQPQPVVLVDLTGAPYSAGTAISTSVDYAEPQPVVLVDLGGTPYTA